MYARMYLKRSPLGKGLLQPKKQYKTRRVFVWEPLIVHVTHILQSTLCFVERTHRRNSIIAQARWCKRLHHASTRLERTHASSTLRANLHTSRQRVAALRAKSRACTCSSGNRNNTSSLIRQSSWHAHLNHLRRLQVGSISSRPRPDATKIKAPGCLQDNVVAERWPDGLHVSDFFNNRFARLPGLEECVVGRPLNGRVE